MGIWYSSSSSSSAKGGVDALKRQQLRNAQSGLLQLYPLDDGSTIESVSTKISRSAVLFGPRRGPSPPLVPTGTTTGSSSIDNNEKDDEQDNDQFYSIHSLNITRRTIASAAAASSSTTTTAEDKEEDEPPLVLLHGYMNGAGYFYRNFAGLSRSFPKLYALDLLGWGLSSRPPWPVVAGVADAQKLPKSTTSGNHSPDDQDDDDPVAASERFFVNSLEAWRQAHAIDKMILAGHSMGGYLAVAYAERYPHRVDQLVLISPVGVPVESAAIVQQRQERRTTSLSYRFWSNCFEWFYRYCTPGDILRHLPTTLGRSRIQQYIERRLPAIDRTVEQSLLADYLYHTATMTGSAEYCLSHLLTPSLFGKRPLVDRIPNLPISACHFFYGDRDWMDADTGGLSVQARCSRTRHNDRLLVDPARQLWSQPRVTVYQVHNAGHLLMLDNPDEFINGMAMVAARSPVLVGSLSLPLELYEEEEEQ